MSSASSENKNMRFRAQPKRYREAIWVPGANNKHTCTTWSTRAQVLPRQMKKSSNRKSRTLITRETSQLTLGQVPKKPL